MYSDLIAFSCAMRMFTLVAFWNNLFSNGLRLYVLFQVVHCCSFNINKFSKVFRLNVRRIVYDSRLC